MRILQINSVYGIKSTGRIAYDLVKIQQENGMEPFVACSSTDEKGDNILSMSKGPLWDKLNILKTRVFGKHLPAHLPDTRQLSPATPARSSV